MQLLPTTADKWAPDAGVGGQELDLYDPSLSVRIGTVYLRNLLSMFEGDQFKAVAAYNGGEHAAAGWAAKYPGDDDQWVENIGFHETRDYVKKVIGGLREYRLIYAHGIASPPGLAVTPVTAAPPATAPSTTLPPLPPAPSTLPILPPVPSPG
jgi:soluble lytic murein transglycosylase